jgi:diguanylate cyclase (GGDEF)-like protein
VTVHTELLIDGLRDLVGATSREDCRRRIEAQADRLFGDLAPSIELAGPANEGESPELGETSRGVIVPLEARGRSFGRIVLACPNALGPDRETRLSAFAEHAAIALDNARMLEDHGRRARRDALTGLLNRGEFHETLSTEIAQARGNPAEMLSVVVFDLDRFKEVNDRRGHGAGDRLLRATAAALTSVCRTTDSAFRIGGDEFALILRGVGHDDASAVARRARDAIRRLHDSGGASWGVANLPADAVTREGLMAVADAAMYERKGRPRAADTLRRDDARRRLEVASHLAVRLTELRSPKAIATAVVDELHSAFGYYLAVIHRLHTDEMLRVLAGAGQLAGTEAAFLAWEQPITAGVNGRVARSAEVSLVPDTRRDRDYIGIDPLTDPGSELSVPIIVEGRVWGVLNLEQLATHGFDENDVLLAEAVVAQIGAALHRCQLVDEMERSFSTTLGLLCDALERKDPYTADHAEQVAGIAMATAERLGLPDGRRRSLRYCALLHDIGKIGVRSELLTKPGPLSTGEYIEVQKHSEVGAALLARIPLLADIAPLVRAVHERWDGHGYPDGLTAGAIPLEARIVAVCDAWHAMTSDRPYRLALSRPAARDELLAGAGCQFDAEVVDAFLATLPALV